MAAAVEFEDLALCGEEEDHPLGIVYEAGGDGDEVADGDGNGDGRDTWVPGF